MGNALGDWLGALVGTLLFLGTARFVTNRAPAHSVLGHPGAWRLSLLVGVLLIAFVTVVLLVRLALGD